MARARVQWNNGHILTTKELDDDMANADLEALMVLQDVFEEQYFDRLAAAVNVGLWGKK